MSDIFDEVDDILTEINADWTPSQDSDNPDVDKGFNEAELQDIMQDIEEIENATTKDDMDVEKNLEEDLEETVTLIAPLTSKETLQNEIDREFEMSALDVEDEILDKKASQILTFEKQDTKPAASLASTDKTSEISFEARGQMNLNLEFKIGEESAKLTIHPTKGLTVTTSGVQFCINQEDGCKVTMDNGVKFIIPLTTSDLGLKKKSA